MKIVIETPDFDPADPDAIKRYLANMQTESDETAAEGEPGDYYDGYGSMGLETAHMSIAARIVGIAYDAGELTGTTQLYVVEPIA